jgi:hypothetical protein
MLCEDLPRAAETLQTPDYARYRALEAVRT